MKDRATGFRSVAIAALVGLAAGLLPITQAAAAAEPRLIDGTVVPGGGLWWDGAHVENYVNFWELCDIAAPCWHYAVDVAEGGDFLRVGLDYLDRESMFAFRVRPPGDSADVVFDPRTDMYNESSIPGPTTMEIYVGAEDDELTVPGGTYEITVAPLQVTDDTFRMRAVLEAMPALEEETQPGNGHGHAYGHEHAPGQNKPSEPQPILPNARAVPPFNFTFDASLDGRATKKPPSHQTVGIRNSCNEDERQMNGAKVCLRFAAGGFNVGQGPLVVSFDGLAQRSEGQQEVLYSDGTIRTHDAGEVYLHAAHRHQHYEGALIYSLHRVIDLEAGTTEQIGKGHKTGYCMTDYAIADWFSVDQQRAFAAGSNCGSAMNYGPYKAGTIAAGAHDPEQPLAYEGRIGWSRGWGDIYPSWREGQYVEFSGAMSDGLYLVRTHFDPDRRLVESDTSDNQAYALIRIEGFGASDMSVGQSEITIERIERGRGEGPWDPNKEVVTEEIYK